CCCPLCLGTRPGKRRRTRTNGRPAPTTGSTAPAISPFRIIPVRSGSATSRSKNYNHQIKRMDKREFIKKSGVGALGILLAPSLLKGATGGTKLRTAHIGVGNMGLEDLKAIWSHPQVE